jgi:hypothetical protein
VPGITNCHFCRTRRCGRPYFAPPLILLGLDA